MDRCSNGNFSGSENLLGANKRANDTMWPSQLAPFYVQFT